MTNITVPLLGLVDTAIVGHMGASAYIGAVAIGTTTFNMVYWLFGFLRMGTTGIVSQAHGAGDGEAIRRSLVRSLMWGGAIALLLLLLQTPLLRFSLWLMQPEAEVAHYAESYFRVCIWGAPAMLASYSLTGWFIGMQDTRTPMWMAILQNLLNILCTIVFVFALHMGVAGVALGTVVGLYGGVAFATHRVRRERTEQREPSSLLVWPSRVGRRRSQDRGHRGLWQKERDLKQKNSVYIHIFLRTLCLVAVTVYFTSAGSRLGGIYLDANALLMQFFIIYSYFTDGLANAAEALSGEYVGRGDREGLLRIVPALFRWGFGLAVLFTLLYAVAGPCFLSLLTNQQEVVETARPYLPWLLAVPLVALAAFVWDGVYIGMTATRRMFISMFVAALLFFVLCFLLGEKYGNHALWLAFLAYLGTRSLMQTLLFPRTLTAVSFNTLPD